MNAVTVGQRTEGKTTLALWLSRQHSPLVVIWDRRGMTLGRRVDNVDDFEDALQEAVDDIRQRRAEYVEVAFVPHIERLEDDFHDFMSTLFPDGFWRDANGNYVRFSCVVDEAKKLQGANWINPDLDRAITQAPRCVLIVQTTHSLQDYNRASKDLMDDLYCFKMKGRSLDAAVEYMDGGDDMRAAIANLPQHHLLHYSFARHDGPDFEIWDDPSLWYVDIDSRAQQEPSSIVGDEEDSSGEERQAITTPRSAEWLSTSERWS